MSKYLNNKKRLWKDAFKPCHYLDFCPYGALVEEYPLTKRTTRYSCEVFGHNCPAFYQAEPFSEEVTDCDAIEKELDTFFDEMKRDFEKHTKEIKA